MYVNLTSHTVTLYDGDDVVEEIEPSGTVARLDETTAATSHLDVEVKLGKAVGLPDPTPDVTYICSMPLVMGLAAAGQHRPDVAYPYRRVKSEDGRTIGFRALARLVPRAPLLVYVESGEDSQGAYAMLVVHDSSGHELARLTEYARSREVVSDYAYLLKPLYDRVELLTGRLLPQTVIYQGTLSVA